MKDSFEDLKELRFFLDNLRGAEMHWFFVQGIEAIRYELYIPGILSLIVGIEASIRFAIHRMEGNTVLEPLSNFRVLSNNLVNKAREKGLPIQSLAFPGEDDFFVRLKTEKPNRKDIELVKLRNNLLHGNTQPFIQHEPESDIYFFTPECLLLDTSIIVNISRNWVGELGKLLNK